MEYTDNSSSTLDWIEMADWIIDSLTDKPVGLIVEIGPTDFIYYADDEHDVACVQAEVLQDDVVLLRRSRKMLFDLRLGSFATHGLPIDRWLTDGHFEDCTDGYIFSRDRDLLAGAVVAWFRDTCGVSSPDDLGCDYRLPDTLLPDR